MKKYIGVLTIVLLMLFAHQIFAQISQGGKPASFDLKNDTQPIKSILVQSPDMTLISSEDYQRDTSFLPRRFSILLPVNSNLMKIGTWLELENGSRICRLNLQAEGALANNLYFNNFYLPKGAKLFLYDGSKKQVKGAFTSMNNPKSGNFAISLMAGETVTIELNLPKETINDPSVIISEFGYAYRDVPHYDPIKGFKVSDWCEVNINCSPEGDNWQTQKNAVVRIHVIVAGVGFWCTGSLVNNTNFDATPYVLTADHCAYNTVYATDDDLDDWMFYFNYESATCDPSSVPQELSLKGATKVAQGGNRGQDGSDFYLVLLQEEIPAIYNPYFLGWFRENIPSENGVTIHHPDGDVKKISTYTTPLTSSGWYGNGLQSHWKVFWAETVNNWGVTESGSSGSPLFNSNGKLIGTLTGGSAACNDNGSPDYYGKFSYHWESNGTDDTAQLKPWLDPDNTGVQSLDGYTLDVDERTIVNNLHINIYPNPASGYFFINFTSVELNDFSILVHDILGNLIKEINNQYQGGKIKVGIEDIPQGVYFLTIKWDHNKIVKKLVIQ